MSASFVSANHSSSAELIADPRGAPWHVGVHDAQLLHIEVVDVEHRRELDLPVDGLERRVSVKQVERENLKKCVVEELIRVAEELGVEGIAASLSNAVVPVGTCGCSNKLMASAVMFRNVCWPMIG